MADMQDGREVARGQAGAIEHTVGDLFERASLLVDEAQRAATRQVNSTLVLRNWHLGRLISDAVLGDERGEYGRQIVSSLARQLTARYGRGFARPSLYRMVQFARTFTEPEIVSSPMRQLGWTALVQVMAVKSPEAREYYIAQAVEKNLSVAELEGVIDRRGYERREIANAQVKPGSAVPLDAFKDPYLLDFLGLKDTFAEHDLESAIIRELEPFLLEAGDGWSFVGRQKRMVIDDKDFRLDLLFFSRPLRRLVAVELKLGRFKAAYKGQMELYLSWLDQFERREGEESPIGLILCTETSPEQIELLQMGASGIAVAEYWTALPPKEKLEERLAELLRAARERIAARQIAAREAIDDTSKDDAHE